MTKLGILGILLSSSLWASARTSVKLSVEPVSPFLFGKGARQPLVVVVHYSDGTQEEITSSLIFVSEKPSVASVDSNGIVQAQGNGVTPIRVIYHGLKGRTTVLVQRAEKAVPPSFAADVLPVLTKVGCNSGNCHGALNGQNGFKLSLFGYEPAQDYEMIVHKHDGRRVNLVDPEKSLLLLKPTFAVKHGGGKLLLKDSADYNSLLTWIRGGAKLDPESERHVVSIRVLPPG